LHFEPLLQLLWRQYGAILGIVVFVLRINNNDFHDFSVEDAEEKRLQQMPRMNRNRLKGRISGSGWSYCTPQWGIGQTRSSTEYGLYSWRKKFVTATRI